MMRAKLFAFLTIVALLSPVGALAQGSTVAAEEAFRRGIAALQANNFEQAIRDLREARRSLEDDPQVNYALGVAYLGNQQPREGRQYLERSVRDDNAPPDAWQRLGAAYLQLGDRERANQQLSTLQTLVARCTGRCPAERRSQLQTAHDQLAQLLASTPAAAPPSQQ
jgi:predicted Zn-dependent protease